MAFLDDVCVVCTPERGGPLEESVEVELSGSTPGFT